MYLYFLNKYIKCNFGGSRCGTSTKVDVMRLKLKETGYFRNVGKYSLKEIELLVKRRDYPALISVSTSALFRTSYGYAVHSNESAMKNALNKMLQKATRSVMVTNQHIDLLVFNGCAFIIYT